MHLIFQLALWPIVTVTFFAGLILILWGFVAIHDMVFILRTDAFLASVYARREVGGRSSGEATVFISGCMLICLTMLSTGAGFLAFTRYIVFHHLL